MKITLENIGKKFNREWIFRNLNYEFSGNNKFAILGTNGCGKSTLLQIIAGAVSESEGSIFLTFSEGETTCPATPPLKGQPKVASEALGRGLLSLAAPYLELPEEMTWTEAVMFHGKFKKWAPTLKGEDDIIAISGLQSSGDKEIRNFSSGMKQRARLTLAILSNTPLLLLDEPSTNLDANAVKWYQNLISEYAKERLVIVCSNYNKEEYSFCDKEFILSTSPA